MMLLGCRYDNIHENTYHKGNINKAKSSIENADDFVGCVANEN